MAKKSGYTTPNGRVTTAPSGPITKTPRNGRPASFTTGMNGKPGKGC
jgi:hypothetical protein